MKKCAQPGRAYWPNTLDVCTNKFGHSKDLLVLIAADWEFSSEDSKLLGYGRNTAMLQKCSCMQVLSDGNIDNHLETAPNSVAKGHLDEISVSVSFSKVT